VEIKRGDVFLRESILPCHVKIATGVGGLSKDSVLLCEQIRVIDRKRLKKLFCIIQTFVLLSC